MRGDERQQRATHLCSFCCNLGTVHGVSCCAKFKLSLAFKVEVILHSNKMNKKIFEFSVCSKLRFTFKMEGAVNGCPTNANCITFVNYLSLNSEILFLPLSQIHRFIKDQVVPFPLRQALLQRLWILLSSLILPLIPAMMAFINIYVLSSGTTCFFRKDHCGE